MDNSKTLQSGLVSVIIPTYNRGHLIAETVGSVLGQTYGNLEVIIVDDGSTDNTKELIEQLNDRRLKYFWQENTGLPAAARNKGLRESRGEFVAFLDSDDRWLPKKTEKQLDLFKKNKDVFLIYSQCFITENGSPAIIRPLEPKGGYIFKELFLSYNFIPLSTVMLRNLIPSNDFYFDEDRELRAAEDFDLWLRISRDKKIAYIKEPLAYYVRHSVNISPGEKEPFDKWSSIIKRYSPYVSRMILLRKYISYYKMRFTGFLKEVLGFVIGRLGFFKGLLFSFFGDPLTSIYKIYVKLMPLPRTTVIKKVGGVNFSFDFSFDRAIKAMFYGLYEKNTVSLFRKHLSRGDTFIDVGSSIGYLSAVALGLVGKTGQVHSFEPVPEYFRRLNLINELNSGFNITTNQCALGEKEGFIKISVSDVGNIGWNTAVEGYMSDEAIKEKIKVPVRRLDEYIVSNGLGNITLMKIDTEGFEFFVLKGLNEYLSDGKNRPSIICEVVPDAYPLLGHTLAQLSDYMGDFGYRAFLVSNIKDEVDITKLTKTTDVIFISQKQAMANRMK